MLKSKDSSQHHTTSEETFIRIAQIFFSLHVSLMFLYAQKLLIVSTVPIIAKRPFPPQQKMPEAAAAVLSIYNPNPVEYRPNGDEPLPAAIAYPDFAQLPCPRADWLQKQTGSPQHHQVQPPKCKARVAICVPAVALGSDRQNASGDVVVAAYIKQLGAYLPPPKRFTER